MSDQIVTSAADDATKVKAESMGWIPDTRYKGDPEKFVDADEYIRKGEEVLPIVKKQLSGTRAELDKANQQLANQAAALKQAQEAIQEMQERHSAETARAVAAAKRDLKSQIAQASKDGDHEALAELTEQMGELTAAEKDAKDKEAEAKAAKTAAGKSGETLQLSPEQIEFQAENGDWFGVDRRKTALFLSACGEIRQQKGLTGEKLYAAAKADMEETLGLNVRREDKVEAAGGRGGEGSSSSRAKGYSSLPAEAKAACDADIKKFVGEGKRFKDPAQWRSHFASIYFEEA